MVSKRLIAASYKPLVLSLLETEEMYGYQIIQRVKRLSGNKIRWTPGRLYPLLHQMETQGLVQSIWRTADSGRDRKYYQITTQGKRAVNAARTEWLDVHAVLVKVWSMSRPELT